MKSPLSRAFSVPDVHRRLRKCLSRCTLDCGFKTPESPALRGFEAERCPITGTSLYLVLKSNGPHRSKNLPVKFGFSSKTVPANIAKKLPPQCCSKLLLIPFFNFSHKWPAFAFAGESGYTEKDRTQRLTRRNRGLPSLDHSAALCRQRNTLYSATLLYTYISRFSVNPQHQQKRKIWQSCCHKFYPPTVFHPAFQLLAQMAHVCFHGRKRVHARLCQQDRTQRPTRRNRGRFGRGRYHYPRSIPHVHEHPRAGYQNGVLCRFWVLAGRCSRRTQKAFGTAMRLCASLFRRRRGPAGLRDPCSHVDCSAGRPCCKLSSAVVR